VVQTARSTASVIFNGRRSLPAVAWRRRKVADIHDAIAVDVGAKVKSRLPANLPYEAFTIDRSVQFTTESPLTSPTTVHSRDRKPPVGSKKCKIMSGKPAYQDSRGSDFLSPLSVQSAQLNPAILSFQGVVLRPSRGAYTVFPLLDCAATGTGLRKGRTFFAMVIDSTSVSGSVVDVSAGCSET
jgi:hypothetical protein